MDRKERINHINDVINDLREFDSYSGYQSMLNLLEEHIELLIEMQEYQNFNINDCVKVKLTEKGKYIYYHQFDDMNVDILKRGGKPLNPIELKYDDEGYVEFQMWHLMEIFGKHLFNGCDIPFETTIKFKANT